MKLSFKVSIGLFAAFSLGVVYIFLNGEGDTSAVVHTTEQKNDVVVKNLANNAVENNGLSSSSSAEKKARIQVLEDKVQKLHVDILSLTGSSGKQEFNYEDNWCVASEDLSEQDYVYANKQKEEWKLTRGYTMPRGTLNGLVKGLGLPNDEFPGINDEYLDTYKEADKETLIRLGNEGDMLALTTIVQSYSKYGLDIDSRRKAAEHLVMLGDTSFGLSRLVIDHLVNANHAKRTGEDPAIHLKSALVMVEFGFMRQDSSALNAFLVGLVDNEVLGGLNAIVAYTESDFDRIRQAAKLYYEDVNKARIAGALPSFEEIDEPKIAQIHYAERLSILYDRYGEILDGSIFPSSWKDNYLRKTPCVARMIATDDFLTERLPAIQDEIAMLQQELK